MYKEELNVLSYNILWRAIDAVEFMSHCKINNINECSQNIANIISKIGLEYLNTNSYDFIGLQEINGNQTKIAIKTRREVKASGKIKEKPAITGNYLGNNMENIFLIRLKLISKSSLKLNATLTSVLF